MERYVKKFDETVTRNVPVVRDGKKKKITTTDKDGYKIVDGKEVRMSPAEIKNRSKSAKKGAKKAKSKQNQTNTKRQKSMNKRPESIEKYVSIFNSL